MPFERQFPWGRPGGGLDTNPRELLAMIVALVAFPTAYFAAVLHLSLYRLYDVSFVALPAAFAAASLAVGFAGAARRWFPWALTLGNVLLTLMAGGVALVLGVIGDFLTMF